MEEHHLQRIAGILQADEVGERERHALGGREAILAVQDHAVAAVEHEDRRAGALILSLGDHEILDSPLRCRGRRTLSPAL